MNILFLTLLVWNANPEPDIDRYVVYFGPETNCMTNVVTVTGTNMPITEEGTNFYCVTAVNSFGLESPPSSIVRWPPYGWLTNSVEYSETVDGSGQVIHQAIIPVIAPGFFKQRLKGGL